MGKVVRDSKVIRRGVQGSLSQVVKRGAVYIHHEHSQSLPMYKAGFTRANF